MTNAMLKNQVLLKTKPERELHKACI